jgi:RNA polymerase sigma factor (sigma-70 family)
LNPASGFSCYHFTKVALPEGVVREVPPLCKGIVEHEVRVAPMMHKIDSLTSDRQLVADCLLGRAEAWSELVERYARLVHSVSVRSGLSTAEVEDVAQDVFLALARNLDRIEDPDRLPGWLATTTRRLTWRVMQKRRQEQPGEMLEASEGMAVAGGQRQPSMAELLERWEQQELLARALVRLGERCRVLLYLIFLDVSEPTYEEISERLAMPKGSIGPTRNRCLAQLRQILSELGYQE